MAKGAYHEVYRKKGVRLTAEMSPLIYRHFYLSNPPDIIHEGLQTFDKAHTVMLTETGVIPREAGKGILKALRQLESEGAVETRIKLGGHLHCGEAYVTMKAGPDVGGWIHCGRSSGDLGMVAHRIAARDYELKAMEKVCEFRDTLLKKAAEHVDTIMPGYTHLQHAEPYTFGFYLLSWVHQLERDFSRLFDAYRRNNISPAGCAIITTTDFSLDRERTKELMGFDGIYTNAKDAIWGLDFLAEPIGALLCGAGVLGRLADDLDIWHSSEFGMVEHPDEFCGTSSIMPQKKNPYGTECVRGLVGDIIGKTVSFAAATKAQSDSCEMIVMPSGHVYSAFELYIGALSIMSGVVAGLKVNKELMRKRAGMYWAQASTLANTIVREKNLPFRTAHQLVGILVRIAYDEKKLPTEVTPEMVDRAYKELTGKPLGLSPEALDRALDPEKVVNSRKLVGAPSAERVTEDLKASTALLAEDRKKVGGLRRKLADAAMKLEDAIDAILAG